MVSWSSYVLNQFVAPGIVEFTAAEIPDLIPEFAQAPHWLANHFLNSVLRGTYAAGTRQLVLGYVRRAYHAFADYHLARKFTLAYLQGNDPHNPRLTDYYVSVERWEAFAIQLSMSFDILRELGGDTGVFAKNDGSSEQRLYTIANQVKHLASCVRSGQCTATDTVPLWLTNTGLASFGVDVPYTEAAAILRRAAEIAEELYDPVSLRERLESDKRDAGS